MSTELRGAKVDMISTKNNDMKQRRVVNAAPAQDSNDYVIKSQVDASTNTLKTQLNDINNKISSINSRLGTGTGTQVDLLNAVATGSITLTTVAQDIPGATLTINQIGNYLVIATIFFQQNGIGDSNQVLVGAINIGGANLAPLVACILPYGTGLTATGGGTFSQTLAYNVTTVPTVVKLTAYKQAGTGTSTAGVPATSLSVVRVI